MCHASVLKFAEKFKGYGIGARILEVGSRNINGSARSIFGPIADEYTGVDIEDGPGVDMVCDASYLLMKFEQSSFDMVISTEMLEHCHYWKMAILNMKLVLKESGVLILTARSPGFPYHNPPDYWRFTLSDAANMFSDFAIIGLEQDSEIPGVMIAAVKPRLWHPANLSLVTPMSVIK